MRRQMTRGANRFSHLCDISAMISRRNLAFSLALLVGLGFVVSAPQLAGARVAAAFEELRGADPGWLWLCGVTLLVSVLCAAGAWRSAIAACRGPVAFSDAAAR